jgi:hypothetical protein
LRPKKRSHHCHKGLCPAAPSASTLVSGSFDEQKHCLLEQIIKSSLEGKSTYKASLKSVLSTGKSEPHLIYKLSFWLSIIKTIVAMAILRVVQIYERQMSWLFVVTDIVCIPSLDFTYSRAET